MANKDLNELKEVREQMINQMEQQLLKTQSEEERLFYHHSSEDRIVLSHALFWVLTQPQYFKGKIRKEKFFLLLRQYQEEMLDAFLQEDGVEVNENGGEGIRGIAPITPFCSFLSCKRKGTKECTTPRPPR